MKDTKPFWKKGRVMYSCCICFKSTNIMVQGFSLCRIHTQRYRLGYGDSLLSMMLEQKEKLEARENKVSKRKGKK